VKTRTLAELIEYNETHSERELALFDQSIFTASEEMGDLDDAAYKEARDFIQHNTRTEGIDYLLAEYDVEVLLSPSGTVVPRVDPINGDVWPGWAGAGSMAARAGYPHVTVPMGTIKELPIGLSLIGGKDQDAKVLSFAYAYEQSTKLRSNPKFYKNAEEISEIAEAMAPMEDWSF
jgi:amidase